MKIHKSMRIDMLDLVKTALLYVTGVPSVDQQIIFKSTIGDILCKIKFDNLVVNTLSGDVASYTFNIDGGSILRGKTIGTGEVASFIISGKSEIQPSQNELISGVVGNSSNSSADIKFNRINWSANTTITLKDLTLIMNQGS